ncbi:MAG: DUF5715 family protein [Terracidiphilus sp.]|nr:DUF5715 family protein [Terracidiphilus sp.]
MRRTSLTVLVQAGLFLMAAMGSPALHAQADTTAPPGRVHFSAATPHTRRHTNSYTAARHTGAARTARRKTAHFATSSSPQPAPRATTHPAARARHAASITRTKLAAHAFRPRPASAHPVPAPEPQAAAGQADAKADQAAAATDQGDVTTDTPATEPEPSHRPVARSVSFSRRRTPMPPPMRGSLTSLERQNEKADADGLERIEDEDDLSDRIAGKLLVPVPVSAALTINGNLPEHHRYCRPWTARFLSDLARAHAAQFHGALEVSSAVRTVEYQKRLIAVNGNAAAAEGDIVSPHLTGATIDIAKNGMSRAEIGWMRTWLLLLQNAGKIDVEEEFQQACFHITVYKSYEPARPPSPMTRAKSTHTAGGQPGAGHQKRPQPGQSQSKSRQPDPDTLGGTASVGR